MRVVPADSGTRCPRQYSQHQGGGHQERSSALPELQRRVGRHFSRPEPRERAMSYLTGLLSGVPRKNGHTLAAFAHETASDGMQRLLTTAKWDVDAVRDELRSCVLDWFGDKRSTLVVGQGAFAKRGRHSAGVQQQYCEATGRLENCQVGLFLAYVSPTGTAFIDRELYLPDEWREDPRRCARAGIPELAFASRIDLARRMLGRVSRHRIPASWIVTSELADIGVPLHEWLQRSQVPNVVEIRATAPLRVALGGRTVRMSAKDLLRTTAARRWQSVLTRHGRWSRLSLAVSPDNRTACWLLMRHDLGGNAVASFAASGPAAAPLAELVRAATASEAARDALSRAKTRVGLDHYEARRYEAWYRHVTLALMADALAEAQLTDSHAPVMLVPRRGVQSPGANAALGPGAASRRQSYLGQRQAAADSYLCG